MANQFKYDEDDPRPYLVQYEEWRVCGDTKECDLSNYPGRGDEQRTRQSTRVVTKKGRQE